MTDKSKTRLTTSDWIFFTIVLIMFYLLNRLSFLTSDDYVYSLLYTDSGARPIESFKDAWNGRIDDYIHKNGRFLVHVVIAWFCGVAGIGIFQIVNSLVFILLNIGFVKLIRGKYGLHSIDKYLILASLFIILPRQGETMLGCISMAVNYLWSSCAIIWFLVLYQSLKLKESPSLFKNTGIILIAAIAGSLHESFSLAVSGALFIYYCGHIRQFRGYALWLTIGFWLGTCVVTFAPGNFARMGNTAGPSLIGRLCMVLIAVIAAVALFFSYKYGKAKWRTFVKDNQLYFYCVIFSILLFAIAGAGRRAMTGGALFFSILLVGAVTVFGTSFIKKHSRTLKISISALLLLIYIPVYVYKERALKAFNEFYNSPVSDGCVVNTSYIRAQNEMNSNFLASKYVAVPQFEKWMFGSYSLMRTSGNNENWVTAILPVSQDSLRNLLGTDSIYINNNEEYCILQRDTVRSCKVIPVPKSFAGKVKRSIKNFYRGKYHDVSAELTPFDMNDNRYYILYTPDYTIRDIIIE